MATENLAKAVAIRAAALAALIAASLAGPALFTAVFGDPPPEVTAMIAWAFGAAVVVGPAVYLLGEDRVRRPTLIGWSLTAATLAAALAVYDAWTSMVWLTFEGFRGADPFASSLRLVGPLLVLHAVVTAADRSGRILPAPTDVIDALTTDGARLFLAVAVGGAVFGLPGAVDRLSAFSAGGAAVVAAGLLGVGLFLFVLRLTVSEPAFVARALEGARSGLAWSTPAAAVLVVAAFAFGVVQRLSGQGGADASAALTLAAAALVFVGPALSRVDERPRRLLLWSAGALALLSLVAAAAAATSLVIRIDAYGLTPRRLVGLATAAVLILIGAGCLLATLRASGRGRGAAAGAVAGAALASATALAFATPLADPARLSAEDQLARLADGRTKPEAFDYAFLTRGELPRYGDEAMRRLLRWTGPGAAEVRRTARAIVGGAFGDLPPPDLARFVRVSPGDAPLPSDFAEADFALFERKYELPRCLRHHGTEPCRAVVRNLDQDPEAEVVILDADHRLLFDRVDGAWSVAGDFDNDCGDRPEVKPDTVVTVGPATRTELTVGDTTFHLAQNCPPAPGGAADSPDLRLRLR